MKAFAKFLQEQGREVDWVEAVWPEIDSPWEILEFVVETTADQAAGLGLDVYRKVPADPTIRDARWFLAECSKAAQPATGKYFDSRQAAEYLGITAPSLYALVERKRLTPLRGPRRTYRFTRDQLDNYLASNS
jgi:excisionase family DNA binding protein